MIRTKSPEEAGLALALIQIDGGTQSRATLNDHVVNDYAEAIQAGATFPPIVVFYDGKKHWLADGFHRFHAYQKAGREKVATDVRQGTRRDAILHSVGANETHGLRRTNDDKRRAVLTLLGDTEWSKWSDGEIAKRCAVSREYVNRLRPTVTCDQVTSERTYTTKHGTIATMKTAGINASRKNAPRPSTSDEPYPEASPQADASSAGREAGLLADREGRHKGEAASVDLPTISDEVDNRTDVEREADAMVLAWDNGRPESREMFLSYLRGIGFTITEGNPAPGTGGDDVDRSAERASSAVEVGANNSPDGADETRGGLPVAAASGTAEEPGRTPAYTRTGRSGTPPVAGVTAGETASNSQSAIPTAEEAAAETPTFPRPTAAATPFNNPRCQKPETCHLVHSRNECFDCTMAWAKRPRDEQVRLWAEAVQAARAA